MDIRGFPLEGTDAGGCLLEDAITEELRDGGLDAEGLLVVGGGDSLRHVGGGGFQVLSSAQVINELPWR